jgi:hypothetical protein
MNNMESSRMSRPGKRYREKPNPARKLTITAISDVPSEMIKLFRNGLNPNTRELLKISTMFVNVKLLGISVGGKVRASASDLKVVVKIQYRGRMVMTI